MKKIISSSKKSGANKKVVRKKFNSGGFVGKKEPDDETPINVRLAERDNRGGSGGGEDFAGVRVTGGGGRSSQAGTVGYATGSMSLPVGKGVTVEPWVSVSGSSRYGSKVQAGGVNVAKAFANGGAVCTDRVHGDRNYKK